MTSIALLCLLLSVRGSDALCTVQRAELLPDQVSPPSGSFGTALGLSGRLAAVGSTSDGVGGTVFLFEQHGERWVQSSVLEPPDAQDRDFFGASLILEPRRLLVTARGTHDPAGVASGSLFVYECEAGSWKLEQQLFPDGSGQPEIFGVSIAATDDRILVGAPFAQDLGLDAGAAYVFRRDDDTWVQEARLLPDPSAPHGGALGQFGWAVAMQGATALIGAPNLGLVYCFHRDGQSWRLEQLIEDFSDDGFGMALAFEGDTALVGAPMAGPGVVHAYQRGENGWSRTATIRRANDGSFGTLGFGSYLAIDAGRVAIGSAQIGTYPGFGTWIVERAVGRWTVPQAVAPLGSAPPLVLGHKVALGNGRLLVADVPSGPGTPGRVFLFDIGRARAGSIVARQGPGNVPGLSARPASVGSTLRFEIPDPPVGSPVIFAFEAPAELPFGSGTLLCQDTGSGLLFVATSLVGSPGGTRTWSVSMPPAPELTGYSFCAQAIILSSQQPYILTNALDIELGSCVCSDGGAQR